MTPVSRRRFLAVAVAGGAAAVVPLGGWRAAVELVGPAEPQRRLAELLRDHDSAAALGQAYLRSHPGAGDPQALVAAVAHGLPADALRNADDGDLRELIAARVRRDFTDDAVVDVDGWVLSCTEARLCALAALAPA